ncbi:hypothetical protein [Fibrella aestuarina]|nr:hypothetical protein [Fibrella aestuarina]
MKQIQWLSVMVVAIIGLAGCQPRSVDPAQEVDRRLARVRWFIDETSTRPLTEDRYVYDQNGRLAKLENWGHDKGGELSVTRYQTYTYDSTGRLQKRNDYSRLLQSEPWRSGREWVYTYPSPDRMIESDYFIDNQTPPTNWRHLVSYVHTDYNRDKQPIQVAYYTREGQLNARVVNTYESGKLVREEYQQPVGTVSSYKVYHYDGTSVRVDSYAPAYRPGKVEERQQTLDSKGRVISDVITLSENLNWEPYSGPKVVRYEYVR